jgi:hypothetical protein
MQLKVAIPDVAGAVPAEVAEDSAGQVVGSRRICRRQTTRHPGSSGGCRLTGS